MKLPDKVELYEKKHTFIQTSDCCDHNYESGCQEIIFTTQNGGLSKEDEFLVIETKRWAIDTDEVDDFCNMLKEFAGVKNA